MPHLVSIVIPVYNEEPAIYEILRRVWLAPMPDGFSREVILVDDGSTDETVTMIQDFLRAHPKEAKRTTLHRGLVNHGKGAALRAGFVLCKGDIIIVQDGDLEYSPQDYPVLLQPFLDTKIDIVFGSRFSQGVPKGMKFANMVANIILTFTVRILFAQNITDEATGFKAFRRNVMQRLKLTCQRFEFCPEFVAQVSRLGYRIHEVPVQYNPRGILEGKKIRAKDGFVAIWWLIKGRFSGLG